MRQILLLVVFVLAARWLVKTMRAAQTQAAMRGARPQPSTEPRQLAEPMVRCAVCGVHAPKSESVFGGARYFCCAEHARRYAARASGREGR